METVTLNSSPKLTKKPSLGDIRCLPGAEKKAYGCGMLTHTCARMESD